MEWQWKEAIHNTAILSSLGDHPGVPLLFGVQMKVAPFRLILQCHGDKKGTLTLWQASSKLNLDSHEWMKVFGLVGDVLQFIHSQGMIQNDRKANSVVLEKRWDDYNPVIIDFGKSLRAERAEMADKQTKQCLSKNQQKYQSKYPHKAPELINGSCPSGASDTFLFAKLLESLCKEKSALKMGSSELTSAMRSAPAMLVPIQGVKFYADVSHFYIGHCFCVQII